MTEGKHSHCRRTVNLDKAGEIGTRVGCVGGVVVPSGIGLGGL